jgi:uncharacterized protein with HEPN domain
LWDILDAIERTQRALKGMAFEEFRDQEILHAALCHYVLIISEASRHVSDQHKADRAHIRWRQIADIGTLIRHVYFRVDPELLWNIYLDEMPLLRSVVVQMLLDQAPELD